MQTCLCNYSISENEDPFPFPTISICAEPFENFTKLKELGLSPNIWKFMKHQKENFTNWPINNASIGASLWESTTFGFWEMIVEVSMISYKNSEYVFNQSKHSFEDENGWLYAKVNCFQELIISGEFGSTLFTNMVRYLLIK